MGQGLAFPAARGDNPKEPRLVREGGCHARVPVALIADDTAWPPCLTPDDIRKLDEVRLALRRRDIAAAARLARIFAMRPIAG